MAFTFTVEDGTGLAGANAYASVASVDDYHSGRGFAGWDGTNAQKQAAIVRATDHVDRVFRSRFKGVKNSSSQALEWPRYGATDGSGYELSSTELPSALTNAIAEYALRSLLIGVLTPDPSSPVPAQTFAVGESRQTSPAGDVIRSRDKVGPIESETEYRQQSAVLPRYPAADMMLADLLVPKGRAIRA